MLSIYCNHTDDQKVEIYIDGDLQNINYNGFQTSVKNIELSKGIHKIYLRQVSAMNKWYWLLTCLNPKEWNWLDKYVLDWYESENFIGYDWNYAQISFDFEIKDINKDYGINIDLLRKKVKLEYRTYDTKEFYKFEIISSKNYIENINTKLEVKISYIARWKIQKIILPLLLLTISFYLLFNNYGKTWTFDVIAFFVIIAIAFYFLFGIYKVLRTKSTNEELIRYGVNND